MSLNYIGLSKSNGRYGFNGFNGLCDVGGGADGVFDELGGDTAEEVGSDGVGADTRQCVFRQIGIVRLLHELVDRVGGCGCGVGGDG